MGRKGEGCICVGCSFNPDPDRVLFVRANPCHEADSKMKTFLQVRSQLTCAVAREELGLNASAARL